MLLIVFNLGKPYYLILFIKLKIDLNRIKLRKISHLLLETW
jgi:hypothetical protein